MTSTIFLDLNELNLIEEFGITGTGSQLAEVPSLVRQFLILNEIRVNLIFYFSVDLEPEVYDWLFFIIYCPIHLLMFQWCEIAYIVEFYSLVIAFLNE